MKKLLTNLTRVLTILMFVSLLLIAVVSSVFEVDFYKSAQSKYDVASSMNISSEDVDKATLIALLYTKGYVDDLAYEISIDDNIYDLYSSQDKIHMVDVKNLYKTAYNTLITTLVISAFIVLFIFIKKAYISLFDVLNTINKSSIYIVIFVGLISLFAYINFDKFWVMFHEIFFDNDLWLMNPRYDALVNLFPEGLFMDLVFKIIKRFGLFFGGFNVLALIYKGRKK